METTYKSIYEWMDKEDMIYLYLYNGILFSHEKEGNSAICDNLDGPWGIVLSKNKSDKEKYYMISLTWNLKEKQLTEIESRIVVTRG